MQRTDRREVNPRSPSDVHTINAEASVIMKRGIGLLADSTREAVSEALACFDQALAMRRQLPLDGAPLLQFGLAACLLNRADALVRLGGAAQIADALRSYDEAIVVLRKLPMEEDPRFPRRLVMALQNRGLALQVQSQPAFEHAIAAFQETIALLDDSRCARIPDRQYLLAVAWVNLANAQASHAVGDSRLHACNAATRAISLVADSEHQDGDAAEVGLKARHVLCRAMARSQTLTVAADGPVDDDVHQATDVVDEALGLVRQWEQKGVSRFRGIAYDLFRFGARVYAGHQPQFLREFVIENMDPARSSQAYVDSPEMRAAAKEALAWLPDERPPVS